MNNKKRRIYYISGYQLAQARDICKFVFGDFFHSVTLNQTKVCFDIVIYSELNIKGEIKKVNDFVDIHYFKGYFGKQWVIKDIKDY